MEHLLLPVAEAARVLKIGRTKMFELIGTGEIESVLIGPRLRRVPADALDRYVEKLRTPRRAAS